MSQQPENEALTSQELRETLLSEIEVSQLAMSELSDEQLEEVAGGVSNTRLAIDSFYLHFMGGGNANDKANSIQQGIRANAEAGKTFNVGKGWTKGFTRNPR